VKKFKVKPEYLKYYCALVGETYNSAEYRVMFAEFTENGECYRILKDAGVLELWCEEVWDWKEPEFHIAYLNVQDGTLNKARLLIRMQSWADFYNKVDGFVPDFGDGDQDKYGIELQDKEAELEFHQTCNAYLFQIALVSVERAAQMRDYFKSDIQSLIDQNLI